MYTDVYWNFIFNKFFISKYSCVSISYFNYIIGVVEIIHVKTVSVTFCMIDLYLYMLYLCEYVGGPYNYIIIYNVCPTGSGGTLVEFLEGWFEAPYCNCMHHWIQSGSNPQVFSQRMSFFNWFVCAFMVLNDLLSSVIGYSYNVFGFTVTESLWFN